MQSKLSKKIQYSLNMQMSSSLLSTEDKNDVITVIRAAPCVTIPVLFIKSIKGF